MQNPSLEAAVTEIDQEQTSPTNAAEHFAAEPVANMWDEPKDDEDDTPAFLRRRKKNKDQGEA